MPASAKSPIARAVRVTIGLMLLHAVSPDLAVALAPVPWDPSPPLVYREAFPVDEQAEATLLAEAGERYEALRTDHFSLVHDAEGRHARYRSQILESVYAAFTLFFEANDFALERPDTLLQLIFFRTREEFVAHLDFDALPVDVEGLYRADRSRAYFFDTLGRHAHRKSSQSARERERELKKMLRMVSRGAEDDFFEWKHPARPERRVSRSSATRLIEEELRELGHSAGRFRNDLGQQSIETMCHEAVHQLSHRMGVLRADRPNPRWLTEGFAVFFEPSAHGFLRKTGAVHWRHWDALEKAHARGERIALRELLTNDGLFFDWSAASLAYQEAWSLVHYLATQHPDRLMSYFRALRDEDPRTTRSGRLKLFERIMESDLEAIEAAWQKHVAGLQARHAN